MPVEMTADGRRGRAILMLAASAVLWSMGGVLIKSVEWDPVAIAGTRSAIAALVVLALLRRPRFVWTLPQVGGAVAEQQLRVGGQLGPGALRRVQRLGQGEGGHGAIVSCGVVPGRRRASACPILGG